MVLAQALYQCVEAAAHKQLGGVRRTNTSGNHVEIFTHVLHYYVLNLTLLGQIAGQAVVGALQAEHLRDGVLTDIRIDEDGLCTADAED